MTLPRSLKQLAFIGGSTQYFEYTIYNSLTGALIDISDLTLRFTLNSAYGQSNFEPSLSLLHNKKILILLG